MSTARLLLVATLLMSLLVPVSPTQAQDIVMPPLPDLTCVDDPPDEPPRDPESDLTRLCARWERDDSLTIQIDNAAGQSIPEGASFSAQFDIAGQEHNISGRATAEGYRYWVVDMEGYTFCEHPLNPLTTGTTRLSVPSQCIAWGSVEMTAQLGDSSPTLVIPEPVGLAPFGPTACETDALLDVRGPMAETVPNEGLAERGLSLACASWSPSDLSVWHRSELTSDGQLQPDQRVVVTLTGHETTTVHITPLPEDRRHLEVINALGIVRCSFDQRENLEYPRLDIPAACLEDRSLDVSWRLETSTDEGVFIDEVGPSRVERGGPLPIPQPMTCQDDPIGDIERLDVPEPGEMDFVDLVRVCAWLDHATLTVIGFTGASDAPAALDVGIDSDGDEVVDVHATGRFHDANSQVTTVAEGREPTDDDCPTITPNRQDGYHATIPLGCVEGPVGELNLIVTLRYESASRPGPPPLSQDSVSPFEVRALDVVRLPGEDVVDYGVAWSRATFLDGEPDLVLLARNDDYADALSSGPLQGAYDVPLLFTGTDALDPRTAIELARLEPREIIVMGGPVAVSDAVVEDLRSRGYVVDRIQGSNRFETAAQTSTRLPNARYLVRGVGDPDVPSRGFADSLAVSAVAAQGTPLAGIRLTEPGRLPSEAGAADLSDWFAIGSPTAVSTAVVSAASAAANTEPVGRLEGPNRAATAVAIAVHDPWMLGIDERDIGRVLLVDGEADEAFASGFASGAYARRFMGAAVLAAGPTLLPETRAYLAAIEPRLAPTLVCAPGVSPSACDEAAAIIGALPD